MLLLVKWIISLAIGIYVFTVSATLLVQMVNNNQINTKINPNNQNYTFYQFIKPLPKQKDNGNGMYPKFKGSYNGLNLLLINNIKTDSYVKQWLTVAADCQEGKLDKYKTHISVGALLGTTMAEQGVYKGTPIPTSMFRWDSSTHSPYDWNPSQGLDLEQAGYNSFTAGGGPIPYQAKNDEKYIGPFQETRDQFGTTADMTSASLSPPSLTFSPKGESHTKADPWFFPDQVVNMDMYYKQASKEIPDWDSLDNEERTFWLSMDMNAGGSMAHAVATQIPNGSKVIPDTIIKQFKPYIKYLIYGMGTDTNTYRCLMMYAASKGGWQIASDNSSYILEQADPTVSSYYSVFGQKMGVSIAKWKAQISSNEYTGSIPGIGRSGYGTVTTVINGQRVFMSYIALTHAMITMEVGNMEYGVMLKYAGLDSVNPTNPDTYENWKQISGPIGPGAKAWVPQGASATKWMQVCHVPSDINPVAESVLNYAFQWLGFPYPSPEANDGPPWVGHNMTCSEFVYYMVLEVTHKSDCINPSDPYTGYEWQCGPQIPLSQAHPGDLILFGSPPNYDHIAFIVSGNSINNLYIINEAEPAWGAIVYGPNYGVKWMFNHFNNQYRVVNMQPFYQSCQIYTPHPVVPASVVPRRPAEPGNPYDDALWGD